ncbi:MAG: hypothetical protein AAF333_08940 [Planctomycetota bacterium]
MLLAALVVCGGSCAAGQDIEDLVRLKFDVTLTTGPQQGEAFSGTLTDDDSVVLDLLGSRPVVALVFSYRDKIYRLGASPEIYNGEATFIPELRPSGSIDGRPVVLHGLDMFFTDPEIDFGLSFVGTTPAPGQFVDQSRLSYGGDVLLVGEFGGPQFTRDGIGVVDYQEIAIPEPSALLAGLCLAFVASLKRPRTVPSERV